MIEICTKRRMIISIGILGVLTVLVLILEEKLTSGRNFTPTPYPSNRSGPFLNRHEVGDKNSSPKSSSISSLLTPGSLGSLDKNPCWLTEEFKITQKCSPCTKFEVNSKTPSVCEETGLKEAIECNKSGKTYRSCSTVTNVERTRFWVFESLMLLITILAYGFIKFRSSQLERQTIKQIERRLAAGH